MAASEGAEQAIVQKFRQLLEQKESLATALIDREHEADEHDIVLRQLEQRDGSKKAWMLVGDVLVERSISETIPEVTKKRDNLKAIAETIKSQLEAKQKEVLEFQEKYNIRIKDEKSSNNAAATSKPAQQGVLVSST